MKRLILVMMTLLAALPLSAEETIRKMVEVKHANPSAVSSLVAYLGVKTYADNHLKTIVLIGLAAEVAKAEEAIHKLDVPTPPDKNIELLAYLVLASNETATAPEPADLGQAIKQMRSLFPYKTYRLLDTLWVRTREQESIASTGLAPAALKLDPNFEPTYQLNARRATILSLETKTVRFDDFSLILTLRAGRKPDGNMEYTNVRINSSFDVREGQKVVIGKTNPTGADSAVILVVTVKIVD